MALANHRVRTFPSITELESFIRTDAAITSIIDILTDNNGHLVLVYAIT